MKVAEAIATAIEMEESIRNLYREHASRFKSAVAAKIFTVLAEEEQGHIDYLKRTQAAWVQSGVLKPQALQTVVPKHTLIESKLRELSLTTDPADTKSEVAPFKRALELETQLSSFYGKLIAELPQEHRSFFSEFLEIEEYHKTIIQAEISSAAGSGVWFDFMEFDQEAG